MKEKTIYMIKEKQQMLVTIAKKYKTISIVTMSMLLGACGGGSSGNGVQLPAQHSPSISQPGTGSVSEQLEKGQKGQSELKDNGDVNVNDANTIVMPRSEGNKSVNEKSPSINLPSIQNFVTDTNDVKVLTDNFGKRYAVEFDLDKSIKAEDLQLVIKIEAGDNVSAVQVHSDKVFKLGGGLYRLSVDERDQASYEAGFELHLNPELIKTPGLFKVLVSVSVLYKGEKIGAEQVHLLNAVSLENQLIKLTDISQYSNQFDLNGFSKMYSGNIFSHSINLELPISKKLVPDGVDDKKNQKYQVEEKLEYKTTILGYKMDSPFYAPLLIPEYGDAYGMKDSIKGNLDQPLLFKLSVDESDYYFAVQQKVSDDNKFNLKFEYALDSILKDQGIPTIDEIQYTQKSQVNFHGEESSSLKLVSITKDQQEDNKVQLDKDNLIAAELQNIKVNGSSISGRVYFIGMLLERNDFDELRYQLLGLQRQHAEKLKKILRDAENAELEDGKAFSSIYENKSSREKMENFQQHDNDDSVKLNVILKRLIEKNKSMSIAINAFEKMIAAEGGVDIFTNRIKAEKKGIKENKENKSKRILESYKNRAEASKKHQHKVEESKLADVEKMIDSVLNEAEVDKGNIYIREYVKSELSSSMNDPKYRNQEKNSIFFKEEYNNNTSEIKNIFQDYKSLRSLAESFWIIEEKLKDTSCSVKNFKLREGELARELNDKRGSLKRIKDKDEKKDEKNALLNSIVEIKSLVSQIQHSLDKATKDVRHLEHLYSEKKQEIIASLADLGHNEKASTIDQLFVQRNNLLKMGDEIQQNNLDCLRNKDIAKINDVLNRRKAVAEELSRIDTQLLSKSHKKPHFLVESNGQSSKEKGEYRSQLTQEYQKNQAILLEKRNKITNAEENKDIYDFISVNKRLVAEKSKKAEKIKKAKEREEAKKSQIAEKRKKAEDISNSLLEPRILERENQVNNKTLIRSIERSHNRVISSDNLNHELVDRNQIEENIDKSDGNHSLKNKTSTHESPGDKINNILEEAKKRIIAQITDNKKDIENEEYQSDFMKLLDNASKDIDSMLSKWKTHFTDQLKSFGIDNGDKAVNYVVKFVLDNYSIEEIYGKIDGLNSKYRTSFKNADEKIITDTTGMNNADHSNDNLTNIDDKKGILLSETNNKQNSELPFDSNINDSISRNLVDDNKNQKNNNISKTLSAIRDKRSSKTSSRKNSDDKNIVNPEFSFGKNDNTYNNQNLSNAKLSPDNDSASMKNKTDLTNNIIINQSINKLSARNSRSSSPKEVLQINDGKKHKFIDFNPNQGNEKKYVTRNNSSSSVLAKSSGNKDSNNSFKPKDMSSDKK
ncbi:hypothetical protein [Cysteiniphilum sp. JM-1]|uniref:hypothetical protein n=1 Tax=Cysteiniphilum sp. JM-1 TaxID=2610891 RepID=UPI001243D7FA|nr:hypothetical protein [Cysteiniphilum sp. JM-1]